MTAVEDTPELRVEGVVLEVVGSTLVPIEAVFYLDFTS